MAGSLVARRAASALTVAIMAGTLLWVTAASGRAVPGHRTFLQSTDTAASRGQGASLDFEFYRENVEPIFMRPRGGFVPGQTACVSCHTFQTTTPLKLEALSEVGNSVFWSELQSQRNFEIVSRLVTPGDPASSRLLLRPLAPGAGGQGNLHTGGIFWESRDDPEWRVIAEWISAAAPEERPSLPTLDFEFFRSCVQPVFVNGRPNHIACAECHSGGGVRAFARRPAEGRGSWTEEESRQSYEAVLQLVEPGHPEFSRLLHHALDNAAGGDYMHNGGRRWSSKDDAEWQALAAWVRGDARGPSCPPPLRFDGSGRQP